MGDAAPVVSLTSSNHATINSINKATTLPSDDTKEEPYTIRDPGFDFDHVYHHYDGIRGKSFLNPGPDDVIPKLHDRVKCYQRYQNQKKCIFYYTNPEVFGDEIYLFGTFRSGETLALRLLNLQPFFQTSVQPHIGLGEPTREDAEEFRAHLNQKELWPPFFRPSEYGKRKDTIQPVMSIDILSLKNGVIYDGIDPATGKKRRRWIYRLNFASMPCWQHYRRLLFPLKYQPEEVASDPERWQGQFNKAGLDWEPQVYHEKSVFTFLQMLYNRNPLAPKIHLQMDATKCKWISVDAPDSFGGHSDTQWTEDKLEQLEEEAKEAKMDYDELKTQLESGDYELSESSSSSSSSSESDKDEKKVDDVKTDNKAEDSSDGSTSSSEEDSNKKKKKFLSPEEWARKRRRHAKKAVLEQLQKQERLEKKKLKILNQRHGFRRTSCIMEGSIDYSELIRRDDIVGAGPVGKVTFDIETGSGKVMRQTLLLGIKPPWPDFETPIDPAKEKPMQKLEDFKELIDRIQDKALTNDELDQMLPSLDTKQSGLERKWYTGKRGIQAKKKELIGQSKLLGFLNKNEPTDEERQAQKDFELEKRRRLQEKLDQQEEAKRAKRIEKKRAFDIASGKMKANGVEDKAKEFKLMHVYPDPNNEEDPVTYINTKFSIHGDDRYYLTVSHSLRTSSERKELKDVVKFRWSKPTPQNEHDMLNHWAHMMRSQMESEYVWHYNGINYDIPYLILRAMKLNCRRMIRFSRFLALPMDELFDKQRYRQALTRLIARPGRSIYRRDIHGDEIPGQYDFPGVRVHAPGISSCCAYKMMRSLTFNGLEFGTLKEVAKKYTKCRCKTFIQPAPDTLEAKSNLCEICLHPKKLHCKSFIASDKPDKCKECGTDNLSHDDKMDGCHSKEGPFKRDLKGPLLTPFFCTNDDTSAVEEFYNDRDTDTTFEVEYQNQMMPGLTELSSLTRTTDDAIFNRGQTIKTWNQLEFVAHQDDWLLDDYRRRRMQKHYLGDKMKETIPDYAMTPEQRETEQRANMRMTGSERAKGRVKYTGGYVIDPTPGVYECFINTLDWNSLYPSLIIWHNLDYATWIEDTNEKDAEGRYTGRYWFENYGHSPDDQDSSKFVLWRLSDLKPTPEEVGDRDLVLIVDDWGSVAAAKWDAYQLWEKMSQAMPIKAPHTPDVIPNIKPIPEWKPPPGKVPKRFCFVVNRESLLPPILRKLLKARAIAKDAEKAANARKDKFAAGVQNARQMALKLSANASYGFCGAVDGPWGGVPIACATCLLGRHYILLSNITSEREFFSPAVYGDTDSIFTRTPFLESRYSIQPQHLEASMKRAITDVSTGRISHSELPDSVTRQWTSYGGSESFLLWKKRYEDAKKEFMDKKGPQTAATLAILIDPSIQADEKKDRTNSMDKMCKPIDDMVSWINGSLKMMEAIENYDKLHIMSGDTKEEKKSFSKPPDPKRIKLMETFLDRIGQQASLEQGQICAKTISVRIHHLLPLYDEKGQRETTMNLELEKQMRRAIFFRRKMYAFKFCWPPKDAGKVKMQGLAGKRRENNLITRNAYRTTIELILNSDLTILKQASASFLQARNVPKPKGMKSLKATGQEAAEKGETLHNFLRSWKTAQATIKPPTRKQQERHVMNDFDDLYANEGEDGHIDNDGMEWLNDPDPVPDTGKSSTSVSISNSSSADTKMGDGGISQPLTVGGVRIYTDEEAQEASLVEALAAPIVDIPMSFSSMPAIASTSAPMIVDLQATPLSIPLVTTTTTTAAVNASATTDKSRGTGTGMIEVMIEEKKKKSEKQRVRPSFPEEELKKFNETKEGKELVNNATNFVLKFFKEACERLLASDLSYEDVQRTAGVKSNYSNDRLAQVQAIRRCERERKIKMEEGQRIAFVMCKPVIIKAKNLSSNDMTYDMSKMYGNAYETSSAEESLLPLHKMYYLCILKKKLIQAVSLIMPKAVLDRFASSYAGRIYREDFGFKGLDNWMTSKPITEESSQSSFIPLFHPPVPASVPIAVPSTSDASKPLSLLEQMRLRSSLKRKDLAPSLLLGNTTSPGISIAPLPPTISTSVSPPTTYIQPLKNKDADDDDICIVPFKRQKLLSSIVNDEHDQEGVDPSRVEGVDDDDEVVDMDYE